MLTFAFTTLTLLIYAVAIAAAYLYARKEFQATLRSQARINRKKYSQLLQRFEALEQNERETAATVKHLLAGDPSSKDPLKFPSRGGILAPTEDRYIKDLKEAKKVTVLGVSQTQ